MISPEDRKALEAIAAAEAAGKDPFGDDEPLTTVDAEPDAVDADDGPQDEPAPEPGEEQGVTEPEATAQAPAAPQDDQAASPVEPEPAIPQYKAETPADYRAQRAELLKQKATAMKQLMDGEIDADAYSVEDARVSDAIEELSAARIRAETLQDANAQTQQVYQQRTIQRLIAKTADEVDYASDAAAQQQFDTSLQVLAAQPSNAGRDFADLADDAHKMVKAMRGVQSPAPAKPAVERKPAGETPVTLRGLPSASTPNTGGVLEQIGRLKGPAYEAAYARLTPAQQAALLDE